MPDLKVCIASSREEEIGRRCREWAAQNLPQGFALTSDPDESDVFISVLYGKLVSEEFINRPGRRCYNFHPGILPQYRGAGAFSWCILNGDRVWGVTLHELDVDIDTGPIIGMLTGRIESSDSAETLFRKGMDAIYQMFTDNFGLLLSGRYHAVPQEDAAGRFPAAGSIPRTYYRKALREAADLTRYARAFHFEGEEQAFWRDRNGVKHYLTW